MAVQPNVQGWLYIYITKMDFKQKMVTRDKEIYINKRSIQQKHITIINIYAS